MNGRDASPTCAFQIYADTQTHICIYTHVCVCENGGKSTSGTRASLLTIILVLNSLQISFKKKNNFNLYSNVTYFNYLFIRVI